MYCRKPSEGNSENLQKAKKLQHVKEENLEKTIRSVEVADQNAQHGESWRLINQLTGRKNIKERDHQS